uniref:Tetrahydroberberine oxidase n=1 Tax=Coptis japonica var. anemonifolia TaxID=264651 RepID=A0A2Z5TUC6_COPJA|nr:tetrahydroberberine oxidase [Coptis japonica var. anemonifolia]
MMGISSLVVFPFLVFIAIANSLVPLASSSSEYEGFLQCLDLRSNSSIPIYNPSSTSYTSILHASIYNLRFISPTTPKPNFIITPMRESHVQATVVCSREHGLLIRTRSGGHDFEGSSFVATVPFVLLDLIHLRTISVNIEDETAWVQTGATIGELYYRIAEKSRTHAFPAGLCPSVGVGGHISGAGYGILMRKYGLSADHVIDARLVDVNGRILDKESMGEDYFWAIRGGGGASFGVILAWKIRLVPVPPTVTTFVVPRVLEQGATALVRKWQIIADKLDEDLFLGLSVQALHLDPDHPEEKTIVISFLGFYLGGPEKTLQLMEESFPELGLMKEDCIEMSWIKSALYFGIFQLETDLSLLLERKNPIPPKNRYMSKSDYVHEPLSEAVLEGIWKRFNEVDEPEIIMSPYGGKMNEIEESAIAFPHRKGNMYKINYLVSWKELGEEAEKKHASWIRELYNYMTPYVSKNPRCSYLNFKDNDLGHKKNGTATYLEAKVWGSKYYKNNFDRLVSVKTKVDPDDFFTNEQSIPPLRSLAEAKK